MIIHSADLLHLRTCSITIVAGLMKNFIIVMRMMATVIMFMFLLFLVVIFSIAHRSNYRLVSMLFCALVPLALTLKFGFLS